MKKSNICLMVLIFCFVVSISSVAASDANDTPIANDINSNQDVQTVSDDENTQQILQSEDIEPVKEATKVSVKTVTGKEKSKVKVKATVKTSSDTPASGVKVTLKVDGKKYSAKTNSKGIATVTVKIPNTKIAKQTAKTKNNILTKTTVYKKTYNCVASVEENDNYQSSSAKFKVISNKIKRL